MAHKLLTQEQKNKLESKKELLLANEGFIISILDNSIKSLDETIKRLQKEKKELLKLKEKFI